MTGLADPKREKPGFNPIHAAAIVLFTFLIYSNTLANGFIRDDNFEILGNPWIRDFSHMKPIFLSNYWAFKGQFSNYYRPVKQVVYAVIYGIFGIRQWGWHLANVLMHAANSVLVYEIACLLIGGGWGALAAGLVFAAHPVHVESVAWVAGTSDTVPAIFAFAAFIVFIKFSRRDDASLTGRLVYFILEFLLLTAAFFSKEPAILMPAIFIVYDIFLNSSEKKSLRMIERYLPFVFAGALYLGMRFYVLGGLSGVNYNPAMGLGAVALNAISYFGGYLWKAIFPVSLNAWDAPPLVQSVFNARFAVSALSAVLFAAFLIFSFRKNRKMFFAGILFMVPILPALDLPALADPLLSERYLYIPLAGLSLIAGMIVDASLRRPALKKYFIWALAALLVFYSAGTLLRNRVWKNEISLWSDTLSKSPDNMAVMVNYADVLKKNGRYGEAAAMYKKALGQMPYSIKLHEYLGDALMLEGDNEGAVQVFQEAISLNSGVPEIHYALARAYLALHKPEAAIAEYRTVLGQRPDPAISRELAGLLCRSGDKAGANALYSQALSMDNSANQSAGQASCQ